MTLATVTYTVEETLHTSKCRTVLQALKMLKFAVDHPGARNQQLLIHDRKLWADQKQRLDEIFCKHAQYTAGVK